ncbi:MAG: prepilin-type N-terminal cleavage/methylation domain-containing protein [Luteimonas sp.]
MKTFRPQLHSSPARARGVTLIELMIALLLGLLVSGAALALFVTNKQTYKTSESLGRVQEAERTAFELMARDLREAAGNACEKDLDVANVLNTPSSNWYTDFTGGVRGYDNTVASAGSPFGTAVQNRVLGTDAIELKSSVSGETAIDRQPGGPSADIKLGAVANNLQVGDIVMACNFDHAAIFQISQLNGSGNLNLVHNTGAAVPGNCSKGLGFPTVCSATGTYYDFGDNPPAVIAKLKATRWYVGYNGRTYLGQPSRSLYQTTLTNNSGNAGTVTNEITEGVRDMQLKFLLAGATTYVDPGTVTAADWLTDKVVAVNLDLTLEGSDRVSTDGTVLSRHLEHTVTIRNRAP